jgi:hypothetical protein
MLLVDFDERWKRGGGRRGVSAEPIRALPRTVMVLARTERSLALLNGHWADERC